MVAETDYTCGETEVYDCQTYDTAFRDITGVDPVGEYTSGTGYVSSVPTIMQASVKNCNEDVDPKQIELYFNLSSGFLPDTYWTHHIFWDHYEDDVWSEYDATVYITSSADPNVVTFKLGEDELSTGDEITGPVLYSGTEGNVIGYMQANFVEEGTIDWYFEVETDGSSQTFTKTVSGYPLDNFSFLQGVGFTF